MTLRLNVDGERWRAHLRTVAEQTPGLVPVAKGNGYGFSVGRLARRTQWLADQFPGQAPDGSSGGSSGGQPGIDTLAVGTYPELSEVAQRFSGDLLVLTPWRPDVPDLPADLTGRVIHTVSRPEDLTALQARQPGARYVLEQLTSMRRHGMTARDLWRAAHEVRDAELCRGVAIHLPLGQGRHLKEVRTLLTEAIGAGLATRTIWVSHLSQHELETLRSEYPDFVFRPRIGTALWLGDRGALSVTATVLDVHEIARGEQYGYRGRRAPRAGHLVIVSGGTAQGIGMAAPTGDSSLRSRVATVARGSLDAAGLVRSPFSIAGKQRFFAEPPHMQASMLFLPAGSTVPQVGDSVQVRVRYTATTFDEIRID